jgi:GMP synthase-like glutamine amidotransferase
LLAPPASWYCIEKHQSTRSLSPWQLENHMRAHVLQHVPFEGLGSIEPWLKAAGYEVTTTKFFAESNLPEPSQVDLLIVLGGPMSVNDGNRYPWLAEEERFVRRTIEAGRAVLGICLGAQLIAHAMGSAVYANSQKEIGWFAVAGITRPGVECFSFPPAALVFHWHGETFDLPAGAMHLARSAACENQAFQLGRSVIGLQFHLETTPASVRGLVEHCREELVEGEYIQTEASLVAAGPEKYLAINALMAEVLEFLCYGSTAATRGRHPSPLFH